MLKNIRVILVETTHPGNIGAVARAMKNMCLEQLYLVNPKIYPSTEATARASGADDVLEKARLCENLNQAIQGCRLVVGASARLRSLDWPQFTPRDCAPRLVDEATQGQVAVVFGRESAGLSNSELDLCHDLLHIPANPAYSSLNLAQAVQLVAYELHTAALQAAPPQPTQEPREVASVEELEGLCTHLEQAMADLGFSHPSQSHKLHRRLRRLFYRARPDRDEINILRGFCSAAQGRKSMRSGS